MEHAPQHEHLPTAEALLAEARGIIQAAPDPEQRVDLYSASLNAGNPEYALNGQAAGCLVNLFPRQPLTGEGSFDSGLGEDGYGLQQIAWGVGNAHSSEHDLTGFADSLVQCAEAIYGKHSEAHNAVAQELLRTGFAGSNNQLLNFYTPEDMSGLDEVQGTAPVRRFLLALVRHHGIDVLDERSPQRYVSDQVWERDGVEPGLFCYTYSLATAYAQIGNTDRASKLLSLLHLPLNKLHATLAIAGSTDDRYIQQPMEQQAVRVADKELETDTAQLSLAKYYARKGSNYKARLRLEAVMGTRCEADSAGAWSDIYVHSDSGDADARTLGVKYWKEIFNGSQDQIDIIFRIADKDSEVGLTDPTDNASTTPRIAWEIAHARARDKNLAAYRAKLCSRLAGKFAANGNADGLRDMLVVLREPATPDINRVRGLTAAALGLQARARDS